MKEIIGFFDRNAEKWDSHHYNRDFEAADMIVKKAGISKGDKVLDVGAGTGILIPFLKKAEAKITALDISPEMIKVIKRKYPNILAICADFADNVLFNEKSFDNIFIYNAFPHFPNPEKTIRNAFTFLRKGGMLLIGHSMNRRKLDLHHKKVGGIVGNHMLISDAEIKKAFAQTGFQNIEIEENEYFLAFGTKG